MRALFRNILKRKDDAECKQKFQLLSQVARKYLTIYASSSASERLLSETGQVQGRGESVNWGGGGYIHIFVLCPTNFF